MGYNLNMKTKKETPQQRYHRTHKSKQIKLECLEHTEMDIIEHLNKQPNKQGYIKKLIRDDIKKQG
jgi:hypothetical protein